MQVSYPVWLIIDTLTLYNTILTFNNPENESFWKHWGEKEKMLVTSIFSFFHNVFYPSQNNFFWVTFIFFICYALNLD